MKKEKRKIQTFSNGKYYIEVKEDNDALGVIIDVFRCDDKTLVDTYTYWNDDL